MTRPISDQVVVITGASSGIGRETALTFGERGATGLDRIQAFVKGYIGGLSAC